METHPQSEEYRKETASVFFSLFEAVERLMKDPRGEKGYDPFINRPDLGPQSRAVSELDPNPIKAKSNAIKTLLT